MGKPSRPVPPVHSFFCEAPSLPKNTLLSARCIFFFSFLFFPPLKNIQFSYSQNPCSSVYISVSSRGSMRVATLDPQLFALGRQQSWCQAVYLKFSGLRLFLDGRQAASSNHVAFATAAWAAIPLIKTSISIGSSFRSAASWSSVQLKLLCNLEVKWAGWIDCNLRHIWSGEEMNINRCQQVPMSTAQHVAFFAT